MKTSTFIQSVVGKSQDRERTCSSVLVDNQGIVYSYGYHYPLATIIDGLGIVNDRGYSSSTGKHIGWANAALAERVGYDRLLRIPLIGNLFTIDKLIESARVELNRLRDIMTTKKRKDTYVYQNLKRQADYMNKCLELLANREDGGLV